MVWGALGAVCGSLVRFGWFRGSLVEVWGVSMD